jgi:hypothetical protein
MYATAYGYDGEFSDMTLMQIGAVLSRASWVNFYSDRKKAAKFLNNMKRDNIKKAAKVLERMRLPACQKKKRGA